MFHPLTSGDAARAPFPRSVLLRQITPLHARAYPVGHPVHDLAVIPPPSSATPVAHW